MRPTFIIKPKIRAFSLEELAFFWNPRPWIPDIVSRFNWPGTSDVRDAIIMLDDEGGHGFLHWYADRASWGLTDKGKRWVADLLSKGRIRKARDWKPPQTQERPEVVPEDQREVGLLGGENETAVPRGSSLDEAEEARGPTLSREEELAALVAEQSADEDA